MYTTFTQFLLGFSAALDLLDPEKGNRGARRAWIALSIALHRHLSPLSQRRVFVAALLREMGRGRHSPVDCHALIKNTALLADCADLITGDNPHHPENRLLDLADSLDLLTLNQYPRGYYPAQAIETLCDAIGSRYSLDDAIALRELSLDSEFWKIHVSVKLPETLQTLSPLPDHHLNDDELLTLSSLLAQVIDSHCHQGCAHSFSVAGYSATLAELYGFSKKGITRVRIAAMLHDLGKLALPAALLGKKQPLTEFEMRQIKVHPQFTCKILSRIDGMHDIMQMASFHHERPNGSGYPFHLRSSQLDLGPRIIAVADNYAALRENRCYRSALSHEQSMKIMQESANSGCLDAGIVEALASYINAKALSVF
ncbi:phosphohydrolase [Serratia sp. Leaf51]|nr:phosphohydrolase [Serratia sp. Leaf51]